MADVTDENLAEAATNGKSGLRKFLWLYFILLPVTAISASTLAILITALQGLEKHKLATILYGETIVAALIILAGIAISYLIATGAAIITMPVVVWIRNRRLTNELYKTQSSIKEVAHNIDILNAHPDGNSDHTHDQMATYDHLNYEIQYIKNQIANLEVRQQVVAGLSVFYALIAFSNVIWFNSGLLQKPIATLIIITTTPG